MLFTINNCYCEADDQVRFDFTFIWPSMIESCIRQRHYKDAYMHELMLYLLDSLLHIAREKCCSSSKHEFGMHTNTKVLLLPICYIINPSSNNG